MSGFFHLCLLLYFGVFDVFAGESSENAMFDEHVTSDFVFWPNATIPFYIDPEHYDHEQSLSIMRTLSLFSFKTCLKFVPVLERPRDSEHVMLFENPKGIRMCTLNVDGHSIDEPHKIVLGYDCLQSPDVDMMVMNALGLPFEHNRAVRDVYIDVQQENIETGYIELFTIETKLPVELRALPYDVNSALHFGQRAFSKNGHKTIIFKDHTTKQNRVGLSDLDLRKIQIIYGSECLNRDRQEKVELCQNYPGVARRKRQVDDEPVKSTHIDLKSLRVNPDIIPPSPPPELSQDLQANLRDLGIEDKIQEIVDQVNGVSALALERAREKYCINTKGDLRTTEDVKRKTDILGIVESVAGYTKIMVEHAVQNLTEFCEESKSIVEYERARCPFYEQNRCIKTNYRSTKYGPAMYSTQHRPLIRQSTKHVPNRNKVPYDNPFFMRATEDTNTTEVRHKRHANKVTKAVVENTVTEVNRRVESSDKRETAREHLEENLNDAPLDKKSKKGDLRLGQTSRPILKTVDYAPTARRKYEEFSFSYILKPSTVRSATWDDKQTSIEQKNKIRSIGNRYGQKNKNKNIQEERDSVESQVEGSWSIEKVNKETGDNSDNESVDRKRVQSDDTQKDTDYTEEHDRERGRFKKVILDVKTDGNKKRKISSVDRNGEEPDRDTKEHDRETGRFKKVIRDVKTEGNKKRKISSVDRNGEEPDRDTKEHDRETGRFKKVIRDVKTEGNKKRKISSVDRNGEEPDRDTKEHDRETGRFKKVIRDVKTEGNKKRKISSADRNEEESDRDTEEFNKGRQIFKKVTGDSNELAKNKKRGKPNRYPEVNEEYTKQIQTDSDDGNIDYNDDEDESGEIEQMPRENVKLKKPKKHSESSEPQTEFIPETVPLSKINREFYNERRWPSAVVRYMIEEDGTFDINNVRARLGEVNKILVAKTCVRLKEIRKREANKFKDYLVLDSSPDYVTGRVGGRQPFGTVELLRGGQHRQHAAMVVMAMLGFYFEVSRHDRDQHIKVHMRHVRPDKLHHFEKIRADATLDLPYDYKSATQPAWQFWRQLGKTGISTVATYKDQDPDGSLMRSLGQNRQLLSTLDLVKINSVYGVRCFRTRRSFQPEE